VSHGMNQAAPQADPSNTMQSSVAFVVDRIAAAKTRGICSMSRPIRKRSAAGGPRPALVVLIGLAIVGGLKKVGVLHRLRRLPVAKATALTEEKLCIN
jgi:hypothetical protein